MCAKPRQSDPSTSCTDLTVVRLWTLTFHGRMWEHTAGLPRRWRHWYLSGHALCPVGFPAIQLYWRPSGKGISVDGCDCSDVRMSLDVVETEASRDAEALFYVIVHVLICVCSLCHSVVRFRVWCCVVNAGVLSARKNFFYRRVQKTKTPLNLDDPEERHRPKRVSHTTHFFTVEV